LGGSNHLAILSSFDHFSKDINVLAGIFGRTSDTSLNVTQLLDDDITDGGQGVLEGTNFGKLVSGGGAVPRLVLSIAVDELVNRVEVGRHATSMLEEFGPRDAKLFGRFDDLLCHAVRRALA